MVYSSSVIVSRPLDTTPRAIFCVPFTHRIAETCPLSVVHNSIAKLQHTLSVSVSDLSAAFSQPSSASEYIEVLPSTKRLASVPKMKRHIKINYTANTIMVPGAPYFIQLEYPIHTKITAYTMSLTSKLNVLGSSTLVKKAERPLTDVNVISRHMPDGNDISVLEIKTPADLSCTMKLPALSRTYKVFLRLAIEKKSPVVLSFDVEVSSPSISSEKSAVKSPAPSINEPARAAATVAPLRPIRSANSATSAPLLIPTKSPLRSFSMNQLATKALSSPQSTSPPNSPSSISGSFKSNRSISECDSASPSTPKSSGSSASSLSDISCSPIDKSQERYSTPSLTSKHNRSASTVLPVLSRDKKHGKSSSMSSFNSGNRLSLSFSRLSTKLGLSKQMEFSCCGPPTELAPPTSPASAASSTRRQSVPSRRVSFKRPTRHSADSDKSDRPASIRSSISDDYLSSMGFQFDGIKSLDATPPGVYDYKYADDEDEIKDVLGIAV